MYFLDLSDNLSETQKQTFVKRWELTRRRGMVFYILRMILFTMLFTGSVQLSDPLLHANPFSADTWTAWSAAFELSGYLFFSVVAGLVIGITGWFGAEEMYKGFRK
ncbi:MAG: hypothetical protein IPM98_17275 [Lewinellaceae bacterium]|nr:hypothetical protein [Lewinellaceae bacterium]